MSKGLIIWNSVILLLITKVCLYAQDRPEIQELMPKQFIDKVEIIAGPSLMLPYGSAYIDSMLRVKIGYSVGLGLIHSLSKRLEMQCRVLWEGKGYKQEQLWGAGSYVHRFTANTTNNYITISVVPRYYVGKENRFHICSGAFYGRLMHSSTKEALYYSNGKMSYSTNPHSQYISNWDAGVSVGGGYSLTSFKGKELLIQAQGNFSIVNIEDNNSIITKYNSIMLTLMLKFYK